MLRRSLLLAPAAFMVSRTALADPVGVTASEIKIGNLMPYSGPASSYGAIGRGLTAYFKMVNEAGGVGGRKINFITLDDGYVPARAVEQARRLVEEEQVAFLLNPLGTPSNSAIQRYMNQRKVPQIFVSSGADKFGDPAHFPWTMGWQPSYRTEAQIYAKYILAAVQDARIAVLFQNDDFGKDYLAGLKDVLGGDFDTKVIKAASYEVTDPTIDSQAITLQGSGANVLITAATPKFAAQMIRKIFDIGWHPIHFMTNVSISVGSVISPAGAEKATGMISAGYQKDWTDARWHDDPGMRQWSDFMGKYVPGADMTDSNYVFAYGVATTALQVLKQCGNDLSRENIMKQAANLHDLTLPTLLPGVRVATSASNFHPIRQMQLEKWTGSGWDLFGEVLQGA